jgi:hypothetical protein
VDSLADGLGGLVKCETASNGREVSYCIAHIMHDTDLLPVMGKCSKHVPTFYTITVEGLSRQAAYNLYADGWRLVAGTTFSMRTVRASLQGVDKAFDTIARDHSDNVRSLRSFGIDTKALKAPTFKADRLASEVIEGTVNKRGYAALALSHVAYLHANGYPCMGAWDAEAAEAIAAHAIKYGRNVGISDLMGARDGWEPELF